MILVIQWWQTFPRDDLRVPWREPGWLWRQVIRSVMDCFELLLCSIYAHFSGDSTTVCPNNWILFHLTILVVLTIKGPHHSWTGMGHVTQVKPIGYAPPGSWILSRWSKSKNCLGLFHPSSSNYPLVSASQVPGIASWLALPEPGASASPSVLCCLRCSNKVLSD